MTAAKFLILKVYLKGRMTEGIKVIASFYKELAKYY